MTQPKLFVFFLSFLFLSAQASFQSPIEAKGYLADGPKMSNIYAGYVVLSHSQSQDLKLIGAKSSAFKKVELHISEMKGGMMRMRELKAMEIPANGKLEMKPGSYHLMFIENIKPIHLGESIDLELFFDDGSSKKLELEVKKRK